MSDTYDPTDWEPVSSGGGITISVPSSALVHPQTSVPNTVQQLTRPTSLAPPPQQRSMLDKLLGIGGPRYQTWPERLVRSAATLPGEVYKTGQVPVTDAYGRVIATQPEMNPQTGYPSEAALSRVQDLTALAGLGSMPSAALSDEIGTLGMAGGKMVQPEATTPVFHSAVEQALRNAPQDKMTASQWQGWLKNQPGVKQEELDWLNLPKAGAPTKAQMLEHVAGHGAQLQEVEKTGAPYSESNIQNEIESQFSSWADNFAEENDRDPTDQEAEEAYNQIGADVRQNPNDYNLRDYEEGGGPKYSEYQLPGGENYRELLLTLPPKEVQAYAIRYKNGPQMGRSFASREEAQHNLDELFPNRNDLEIAPEQPTADNVRTGRALGSDNFTSSHWDEPNVLVHMRMNDRVIPDSPLINNGVVPLQVYRGVGTGTGTGRHGNMLGEGIYFTNKRDYAELFGTPQEFSVQPKNILEPELHPRLGGNDLSKWARENGYDAIRSNIGDGTWQLNILDPSVISKPPLKSLHLEEVQSDWHQEGRKKGYKQPERYEELRNKYYGNRATPTEVEELNNLNAAQTHGVPDAPFKTTWADLALKRAIAKAAREGYDAISWTPGEQQAERYDLSKQVNNVRYQTNPDDTFKLSAEDKTGRGHLLGERLTEQQLADHVGKDVADKIIKGEGKKENLGGGSSSQPPDEWKKLEGLDLKVGGEGMKKFYDKMLVDKANALGKKFGTKVEYKELPRTEGYNPQQDANGEWWAINAGEGPGSVGPFETRAALDNWLETIKQPKATRVPVLRLTPKLKAAATGKGFPLFSNAHPGLMFTPVERDKDFLRAYQKGNAT